MAQEIIRHFTCDRCKKRYDEGNPESKATPATILLIECAIPDADGVVAPSKAEWQDLCPKCAGRVLDLLSQIRLDKPDRGERSSTDGEIQIQAELPTDIITPPTTDPNAKPEKSKARAGGSAEPPTTH